MIDIIADIIEKIEKLFIEIRSKFRVVKVKFIPRVHNLSNAIYVRWLGREWYFEKK